MGNEETTASNAAATNAWNTTIIEEFRANEGKVGGPFEGAPVLLLHTKGAKSGLDRVNPIMYLKKGERVFVFASKAGADTDPDWFRNLIANPIVSAEIGGATLTGTATPLSRQERDRVYAIQAERFPGFAEYEAKTSRVIPVVELVLS
jgi:deazaflavin-dependent oxidoreductase (nitroreductase family)